MEWPKWLFLIAAIVVCFILIRRYREKDLRKSEEDARRRKEEAEIARRERDIRHAVEEAKKLAMRGAIFEITTTSDIRGYLVKELGWVRCEGEERSVAESKLRIIAAERYEDANAITKLSFSLREERYEAGKSNKGNPYYRNRKIKTWEAMACEAIPSHRVDKSPPRFSDRVAVVDGSNVAHWDKTSGANLEPVKAVVDLLRDEGVKPIVVFDASIGFKIANKHLGEDDVRDALGDGLDIEIVESGTVADRRIVEIAERDRAVIVSNDFFRDSLRARHIPKRCGLFISKYEYAELLPARPPARKVSEKE